MSVADLIPTLQPLVEQINTQLRFICFFILTASIIVRTGTGSTDLNHLLRPLMTNTIICAFLATLPFWFNLARDSFWNIAVQIQQDFTGSIDGVGAKLMQQLQPPDGQINWLDVSNSIWRAVQYAIGWIVVWIGAVIQIPMMLVQYIMECLCYLFLPIALSLFAFDGTKGLALRYVQQTLAVLAWPIGFAVIDLVGDSLLTSMAGAIGGQPAAAAGLATEFGPDILLVAGLVALWLILGSLAVPIIMQALFCSGSPMSSAVGHTIQYGMAAAGLARLGAGGGGGGADTGGSGEAPSSPPSDPRQPPPAPPSAPTPGGGGGIAPTYTPSSSMPALIGPMQRAALPTPASGAMAALPAGPDAPPGPAAASALPPSGHTQRRSSPVTIDMKSDPSGTLFAASVLESSQIPMPISY